jgi:hypothetical protein
MAAETLVESLITDSIELVRQLDTQGDSPTNALWYFYSDIEDWLLLIAGPSFDILLPQDAALAYRKIANAFSLCGLGSLTIAAVKVIRTDDAVLAATKLVLKTPPTSVVRAHFRNNMLNGVFVKEMLVLRAA